MTIKGKCDAFIVPNNGGKIKHLIGSAQEKETKKLMKLCEANDTTFDPEKDTFIQLWFVGTEDFGCDNMQDHVSRYEEDGNKYFFEIPYFWYPTKLFSGKEGETIHVKFPEVSLHEKKHDEDEKLKIDIELDITLKQSCYRYARFGNYEDVLKQVLFNVK